MGHACERQIRTKGQMRAATSGLNAGRIQSLTTKTLALLPAPVVDEPKNIVGRPAGDEARDVVEVNPSAPRYFAARPRLGLPRYFARKHVVVFLLAANVEQIPGCLAGEPGLFPEFSQRGFHEMLAALQHAARERPLRLTARDQENSLTSATNHGGPFLQLELPFRSWGASRRISIATPDLAKHRNTESQKFNPLA